MSAPRTGTPDDTLVVEIELTRADMIRANLQWFMSRWMIRVLAGFGVIGIGFVVAHLLGYDVRRSSSPALPLLAGACVWALFMVPFFALLAVFNTARLFSQMQDFHKRSRCEFGPDGISGMTSASSSQMSWTAILAVREVKDAFWFFLTKNAFQIVPKRCFGTSDDVDTFRRILRQALGDKAKVQSLGSDRSSN